MLHLGVLNGNRPQFPKFSLSGCLCPIPRRKIHPNQQTFKIEPVHLRKKLVTIDCSFTPKNYGDYVKQMSRLLQFPDLYSIRHESQLHDGEEVETLVYITLGRLLDSSSSFYNADSPQVKKIGFYLHNILDQLCDYAEKAKKESKVKNEIRSLMDRLVRSFMHCNDRIEQELALIYGELFHSVVSLPMSTDDLLLLKIRDFREAIIQDSISELSHSLGKMDESTTAKYYCFVLQTELGLGVCEDSMYSRGCARKGLEKKVSSLFWKKYKFSSIVHYLNTEVESGGLPFGRLYDWFQSHKEIHCQEICELIDPSNGKINELAWSLLLKEVGVLKSPEKKLSSLSGQSTESGSGSPQ